MGEALGSILRGTAGLTVAAGVAVVLAATRGRIPSDSARLDAVCRVALLATLCQAAHFGEELLTGFSRRFPEQLGLAPWPLSFFVPFNLLWLVVWVLSSRRPLVRSRPALAALWFLGIAGLANGVAHPLLAARTGGYFPGLVTSPLVGAAGVVLLWQLARATRRPARGEVA